jgi:hypothetical protein
MTSRDNSLGGLAVLIGLQLLLLLQLEAAVDLMKKFGVVWTAFALVGSASVERRLGA